MSTPDPWKTMSPEERREMLDDNELGKQSYEIFHETLEYAEELWSRYALFLINAGARPEMAIPICADACALEHHNMRARWTYESLNGLELPGTRRSISPSEAAMEAIDGLVKAAEPPATPALGNVWKNRFTQKVQAEINRQEQR